MSIYRVNPGDIETFTVVTNPHRTYTSNSMGPTGSVYVFARRSSIEKEIAPDSSFIEATHDDADLGTALQNLQNAGKVARLASSSSLSGSLDRMLDSYMSLVARQGASARKNKLLDIIRFTPSISFTSNTLRKLIVKENLSSYYRTDYPSAHWAYTNYNSLNFFTASTVPSSSALLYPNVEGGPAHTGYVTGVYSLSGAFSLDCYVNPRYRPDSYDGRYKAGTIVHLSSSYALSLVTGSSKDQNGLPLGFRLKLQLSHSADIKPSVASPGTYPSNLIFLSDDNSLQFNRWHHVVVRWGTSLVNHGTGSFNIDGVDKGTFVVPSGTVAPKTFSASVGSPSVLCVGNYFEGGNAGTKSQAYFFAADPALRDGLTQLINTANVDQPVSYSFSHQLNAELHDVAIKRYYMSDADIVASASLGPKSLDAGWTAFYLPPFFVEESPFRQSVNDHGGILQTPFFEVDGTTSDPFNVPMAFSVAGHYVNIENFLKDFANNSFPRVHHMTGTAISFVPDEQDADNFLYAQPYVRRRNLLLMPCDDGLFIPGFELLASESKRSNFIDDMGLEELSFIHLDDLVSTASLMFMTDFGEDFSYTNELMGFTPEQPGLRAGPAYTNYVNNIDTDIARDIFDPEDQTFVPSSVFQRTRDPSSNQVTFFDISNLFYGKRILPGSLVITDAAFTGTAGVVKVTLKDDGRGTVYRADSYTSASTWNSVGTVFYNEGIVAIKSPHLYFFGKEGYEISFKGEQNVHVMKLDVLAPANQLNSSSNPNFKVVPPSPFANDPEKEFVYITGINLHDADLNVVMKTQLAQPIIKRSGDRISYKIKIDF